MKKSEAHKFQPGDRIMYNTQTGYVIDILVLGISPHTSMYIVEFDEPSTSTGERPWRVLPEHVLTPVV